MDEEAGEMDGKDIEEGGGMTCEEKGGEGRTR